MLQNKVILVSGGFSGVGKAVTELFMQAKARVVAVGRNQQNKVPSYTGNYLPIVRNLRTEADADEVVEFALEKFGTLDIVLHCAGKILHKPAADTSRAELERIMVDNFYAAASLTRAALPHFMRRNEGLIVFMPGSHGSMAEPQLAAYCAAKHALVGYAQALRHDLLDTGIRVAGLCLGPVDTEFWHETPEDRKPRTMTTVQDAARTLYQFCRQPDMGLPIDPDPIGFSPNNRGKTLVF